MSGHEHSKGAGQSQIRCEDIQELLFDYMSHELGSARSILVREHLRHCEDCTKHAAEIQSTLDLLNKASKEDSGLPSRLTDKHRKKLYWWISHPVMLWIDRHHILFSLIVTLIAIAALAIVMAKVKLWEEEEPVESYPIWIGTRIDAVTNAPPQSRPHDTEGDSQ